MSDEAATEGELKPYVPFSDERLREIAADIIHGKIFTSNHVTNENDLPVVFMPLSLVGKEYAQWSIKNQIAMIWEYMDKRQAMSVNGCPTFISMKLMSRPDVERLKAFMKEYQRMYDQFTGKKPAQEKSE